MIQCKHQVIDKEKSSWTGKVYRNCKLEAKQDGYCDLHNPKRIAESKERELIFSIQRDEREIIEKECYIVGTYMLLKRAEEFKEILKLIRDAEELRKIQDRVL